MANFNARFHDCHATLGPMDYTRQPDTDLMHLDCTGLISHRQCASHEALPVSRSIEAGNTVIVVPLGRSSFILAHENAVLLDTVKQYEGIIETLKQRQSAAGIDTEDTTATGTYTGLSNDYPHVPPESPTPQESPPNLRRNSYRHLDDAHDSHGRKRFGRGDFSRDNG